MAPIKIPPHKFAYPTCYYYRL